MTSLGQIVAIHKSTRVRIEDDWTAIYKQFQSGGKTHETYQGLTREHQPDGDFPQQFEAGKKPEYNATLQLSDLRRMLTRLIDLTATKDTADTEAKADVVLSDGSTLLEDVPVAHLLWLEGKLTNLVTVLRAIPVLNPAETWLPREKDDGLGRGVRRTAPEIRPSREKVTEWKQIVPATDKHPADVRQVSNDIRTGTWTNVRFTTAFPAEQKDQIVRNCEIVLEAVKQAIPVANKLEVTDVQEANTLLGFIFGDIV
jgi:hypothetical protein